MPINLAYVGASQANIIFSNEEDFKKSQKISCELKNAKSMALEHFFNVWAIYSLAEKFVIIATKMF